jgi:hypothetical protein
MPLATNLLLLSLDADTARVTSAEADKGRVSAILIVLTTEQTMNRAIYETGGTNSATRGGPKRESCLCSAG